MTQINYEKLIGQWHLDRNLIEGSTDKDQYMKLIQEVGELSDSLEESNKKIITKLPVGSSVVANNYFWLHGRKAFKEHKDLSRELLRIRGSFFIN